MVSLENVEYYLLSLTRSSLLVGINMNKYLKRGIGITLVGMALIVLGMYLKGVESGLYGITLIVGVVIFGVGFVTIVYSLIRKIERQSILDTRNKQSNDE